MCSYINGAQFANFQPDVLDSHVFLYMGDVILVFRAIASKRQDKALALPRIYPIEENPEETNRGCATYFSNF